MNARRRRVLEGVLSCPTAPFCERAVIEYARRWADRLDVAFAQDQAGNVLLGVPASSRRRGGKGKARPTWVFTAHMDHPGFVVVSRRGRRVRAQFRGGVAREYFPNSKVRLIWPDCPNGVPATVTSVRKALSQGFLDCGLELARPADVPAGAIGMWDVPVFRNRNGRVAARACDDLVGTAAVLAAMEELIARGAGENVMGLLTRAEEVGFVGALAACRHRTIPAGALVVGIETSKAQPAAKIGDGVVIRVGDRARVFNEPLTAHIAAVAGELAGETRNFRFVRQLMPGGTCESTAYCAMGETAAALCVPLGNYHNQSPRGKIAAEIIGEGDFDSLVGLLAALAADGRTPADTEAKLQARLDGLLADRGDLLDATGPWSPRR